jgi:hypothetical protein
MAGLGKWRANPYWGEALSMKHRWTIPVALLFSLLAACSMIHGVGSAEGGSNAAAGGFVLGPTFHF